MINLRSPEEFKSVLVENPKLHSIFLAGSIEMGKASEWQIEVTKQFENSDVIILNPRRLDWDSSWKQDISDPHFRKQVYWEHDALEDADHVLMFLEPTTMAPVSLMEAGLMARKGSLWICCPEGYWRRGNIQVLCERHDIPLFDNLDEMIRNFREEFSL